MTQKDMFQHPGEILRDRGIQQAIDHADAVEPSWSDMAYEATISFIGSHMRSGDSFTMEYIRLQLTESNMISKPPDARAWGGIMRRLAKAGYIMKDGFIPAESAIAHRCPKQIWRIMAR